jgi:integrase
MGQLTEKQIRALRPASKAQIIADGNGLALWINPKNGGKYWRLRYSKDGKQNMLSLGIWNPDNPLKHVTLQEARDKAFETKKQLKNGLPLKNKKQEIYKDIASATFEEVAREFIKVHANRCALGYERYSIKRLEQHVFPFIGNKPIDRIEAPDLLAIFRKMEANGIYDLTHRCKELCGQTFRYGIATGQCKRDLAADLKGALIRKRSVKQPAIVKPKEFGQLMCDIRNYDGETVTRLSLELLAHTFLRTSELRLAKWDEFDFENKLWTVPKERMKIKIDDFIVPLTAQSLLILRELKKFNSDCQYVFAYRDPNRPISEQTMIFALYRLGYKSRHCCHGFRSTASTILNEQRELGLHQFSAELIEFSLSHADENQVRSVYNRSKYLQPRRALYQYWSNYVEGLAA